MYRLVLRCFIINHRLLNAVPLTSDFCLIFLFLIFVLISALQVIFHDVNALTEKLFPIVEAMQKLFSAGTGTYYSDSIFFLSVALHHILPKGNLVVFIGPFEPIHQSI